MSKWNAAAKVSDAILHSQLAQLMQNDPYQLSQPRNYPEPRLKSSRAKNIH